MIRAYGYLAASGVIWFVEGGLFAHFLGMALWQIVILALMYASLFALAVRLLVQSLRTYAEGQPQFSPWRAVSLAPMVVTVVGSFVSLPIVVLVAVLGKVA